MDGPFDPKKNKVYIKVTPPVAWQKALAKLTPAVQPVVEENVAFPILIGIP